MAKPFAIGEYIIQIACHVTLLCYELFVLSGVFLFVQSFIRLFDCSFVRLVCRGNCSCPCSLQSHEQLVIYYFDMFFTGPTMIE